MEPIDPELLSQIVELAESVPERYRDSCFQVLLSYQLSTRQPNVVPPPSRADEVIVVPAPASKFILPIDVKAFLSQYEISEDRLWRLFFIEGSEVRPIYQLKATSRASAQIQTALLMSMETALATGQFQVPLESLRTRCQEQKVYESSDFTTNLKYRQKLFKEIDPEQPLVLSPDGKSELADLVEELTKIDEQA